MSNNTARDFLRDGYKTTEHPKKEQETHVELKEADVDKASTVRLLSWGYKKLVEQANATDQND